MSNFLTTMHDDQEDEQDESDKYLDVVYTVKEKRLCRIKMPYDMGLGMDYRFVIAPLIKEHLDNRVIDNVSDNDILFCQTIKIMSLREEEVEISDLIKHEDLFKEDWWHVSTQDKQNCFVLDNTTLEYNLDEDLWIRRK